MQTTQKGGRQTLEVLVSFDGAVVGVHHLRQGQSLRFGPPAESPEQRPDYPVQELPMLLTVASCGAVPEIGFPLDAQGEVTLADGGTRTLAQLGASGLCQSEGGGYRYALPDGARARMTIAGLDLVVSQTELPERTLPSRMPIDWRSHRFVAVSFLVNSAVLALAMLMPPDPRALASNDLSRLDNETLRTRFIPAVIEFKVPPPKEKSPDDGGGTARPVRGPAGLVGDVRSRRHMVTTTKEPATENKRNGADLNAEVQRSGIIALMGQMKASGPLAQIVDPRARALGDDADSVLAGLVATADVPGWGTSGMSLVQTGPGTGGGCVGGDCGTVAAALDRVCVGANCASGPGGGGRGPRLPKLARDSHQAGTPEPRLENPRIIGGLDREIIRRVIRSHMNEFKFCYEKELNRQPELGGRVVMAFVIGRDGRVVTAGASESTMKSQPVHACLSQVVQRLSFPAPEGGHLVQVSYPFVFHRAAE